MTRRDVHRHAGYVIIDIHTHIFPPRVRERREEYLRRDPTFAEMYASEKSRIATGPDLLESMDRAGVDVSVALGFAWRDQDLIEMHNDYLLETADASQGRIIPFATVNMAAPAAEAEIERCAAAGARGLGELRPDSQGWDLNGPPGDALARLAGRRGLTLLFHVTERGGHAYSGKDGLALSRFHAFAVAYPRLAIIGAHLGGGVYSDYRSFGREAEPPDVFVDTAAQPFLYPRDRDRAALANAPVERLLFGSDYPLIAQERQIADIEAVFADEDQRAAVLGRNAQRLLGIMD